MARKKNLERAIILGLILSTGVYGSAWAESIRDSIINSDVNINIDNDNPTQAAVIQEKKEDIILSTDSIDEQYQHDITINSKGSGIHIKMNTEGSVVLTAKDNTIKFGSGEPEGHGITIEGSGYVKIAANGNNIIQSNEDSNGDGINLSKDSSGELVVLTAGNSNKIKVSGNNSDGIYTDTDSKKSILLTAYAEDNGTISGNIIEAGNNGIDHRGNNSIRLSVGKNGEFTGINKITAERGYGVRTDKGSGDVTLEAGSNEINSGDNGIQSDGRGTITLTAYVGNNKIAGNNNGVYATNGEVGITSIKGSNIISAQAKEFVIDDETNENALFGNSNSVSAYKGTTVDLTAANSNILYGAVYASGNTDGNKPAENLKVTKVTKVTIGGISNNVYSAAVIDGAGDINTKDEVISGGEKNKFFGKRFVSALYAEDGANIELTGENEIGTWADSGDSSTLERTVWAYSVDDTVGSSINITGASIIGTDRYSTSPNSADVAIAAGTATDLSKSDVKNFVNKEKNGNAERSTVTFKYDNFDDGKSSSISGDILSAYAGLVDISADNSEAGINITGNLLAGNNGILSVDLGKGGVLTGRADDYGNAGYVDDGRVGSDLNGEQKTFYDPAFSSTIFSGGNVGLKMGAGSRWNVTGQSWITSIDTSNANGETQNERATIDLVYYYKDETGKNNTNAHALTVYDFNGDADFIMNLDGNRANSDMLYMKKAIGTYRINLIDVVTTDEINRDHNGKYFSGLRFATVGNKNSNVTFLVGSYDNGGAFNVEYEVGTDEYGGTETADENTVYNGGSINSGKPGDSMVDGLFGNNDDPVGSEPENVNDVSSMNLVAANNIMLMSEEAATLDETVAAANDATDYDATNHKIIARAGEEISDTGKTILNMSRANYSNAIYMDRLNKRLGEARYINSEEDEGMWVRIRHDRIGKDNAYRSQNTMYELGYDQKQECDNGERRVGMAIDYMHGDTGYNDIAGKGEIDRYGLWLYDTWMGDKGHYADYVAKWGHLSNDFEVYTMNDKTKQVTGDYSNNVFSVSAEYGRKKDIGNDWYFEPQVQAQLARVTGADYTTSQGTKVSVDGINSLIGRAGFRLGKDFGEEKQSTVYIKADVLHEFLGDQDVRVLDKSSDNKWAGISYENEGTWYDVGFGFATQMGTNSYAFMDFEKSFGNDNDETYQINVGMQWSF